jgi:hypothetical protein
MEFLYISKCDGLIEGWVGYIWGGGAYNLRFTVCQFHFNTVSIS